MEDRWITVEEVHDSGDWEVVYNVRVSDHHTYYVGEESWGWSIWAHNTYYYHATNAVAAENILANGVNLSYAEAGKDFGKASYTTIDIKQARNFVNLRYPGIGAILKFNVNQSTLSNLQIHSFAGVTQEWQEAVWAGRNGLFDIPPMPFDVVFGPYLTNTGAIKPSGASAVNTKGRGDQ